MGLLMKMSELLFLLACVLCVSAGGQYDNIYMSGCSDTDGEDMYGLEGEEIYYADFIHNRGVEPQPPFVDHINFPGAYEVGVSNQQICKSNLKNSRSGMKDLPLEKDPPTGPIIYTRDDVELGEKNDLICHVTGFFPAPVKVYWTKNGQNVTEGTSINVPYPNKDGTFNQFSRLEFVPQQGDMYSCSVEHPALTQPITKFYDVEKSLPSIGPAVFCGVGLTVGLLGVAAGTFFLIKGNECS